MSRIEHLLHEGNPSTETDKPVLILTIGLPRSGKSTWARAQGVPTVNPDAVRLAFHGKPFLQDAEPWIWATIKTMIKALFLAGHYVVILDACNHVRRRRDDWRNDMWRVAFHHIGSIQQPSPEWERLCIERAKNQLREDLIPVIRSMTDRWEPWHPSEGPLLKTLVPYEHKDEI